MHGGLSHRLLLSPTAVEGTLRRLYKRLAGTDGGRFVWGVHVLL